MSAKSLIVIFSGREIVLISFSSSFGCALGCCGRISREGEQIFEGDLASLKRFKDDVKEVKTGYECGLVFDGFNDIQEFDIVEAYKMVEVPR